MSTTRYQNVRVMLKDSYFTFDSIGSYEHLVSEASRAFNLDPLVILSGSIKIFYFDFADWIRVSSEEEFALSFFYKDSDTPFVLKSDNVGVDVDSNVSERKERKRGKRNDGDNDGTTDVEFDSNVSGERKERKRGKRWNDDDNNADLDEKSKIEAEQRRYASYLDGTSWPENVTHLFIDGNNILYLTKTLRDNTLKKRLNRAQEIIVAATEYFASRITGLTDAYVIFDNISSTYDKILENGTNLFIRSARPTFSTTDDMLVNWSEQNKDISSNSLHISSDRALSGRLNIEGAKVMKPKAFFSLTLKLTNQENETIDSWFSKVEENLVK
jgi:hypothetical protein